MKMSMKWEESIIGDHIELAYGDGLPERDRKGGKYPVYGSNGVVGFHDRALVKGPGIIIGRKGTVGQVTLSKGDFWPIDTTYYVKLKEDGDIFFWFYLLQTLGLCQMNSHSAVPGLNRDNAYNILKEIPPPVEQRAIAKILFDLDEKIELNNQMNKTLETIGQALFKQWFVDFEFPDKNGKPYKSLGGKVIRAELGEIPRGWLLRSLYECADYINGSSFRNEDFSVKRQGLPIIKIGELKSGISDQTMFTDTILEKKYRVVSGDTLFSWSGSPDTSIDIFIWAGSDGWLNQHIFKIQFKREEDKYFVYFLLKYFKPIFIETARNKQTTGLGHVTGQDLKRLKTVFPSDDVLKAFNKTAEPLFQNIFNNLSEANVLMDLRDFLLPKLMSGKVRVEGFDR